MAKTQTVADLLVDLLIQADVKYVWGLPGDSLNGFTESLRVRDEIAWRGVRHEEVAALAATYEAVAARSTASTSSSLFPAVTSFSSLSRTFRASFQAPRPRHAFKTPSKQAA